MKPIVFDLPVEKEKKWRGDSFVSPPHDDSEIDVPFFANTNLHQSQVLSLEAGVSSEAELIENYRTVALYPEIDDAIEEITSEAIVYDENQPVVSIQLERTDFKTKTLRQVIQNEFSNVLNLLNFNNNGYQLFREWYIDSRLYFHIIIDPNNPKDGIKELRRVDPRKLKKVRIIDRKPDSPIIEVKDEFFVYLDKVSTYNKTFSQHPFGTAVYNINDEFNFDRFIKIHPSAIASVNSGLIDRSHGIVYGYLQKSIKYLNQLRLLEDSLVIYRIARAPEKRVFYVDVGNMPQNKADSYLNQIQRKFRNRINYDVNTGTIVDHSHTVSLQEDFFLPRRGGSRGTQIDTLAGSSSLSDIDDILYFKDKLLNSLNVPIGRLKKDSTTSLFGNDSEVSREEIKFKNFIDRLRSQFNNLFLDILKTQLILKGIISLEEWERNRDKIDFSYSSNSHFAEKKEIEIIRERLSVLAEADPFVGKYFQQDFVLKKILRLSEEEIDSLNVEDDF